MQFWILLGNGDVSFKASSLSDDQLSDAREVFNYFDTKGDDRVSVRQVGDVLRALGQNPTESEVKKCCAHWNDPGSLVARSLDFTGFCLLQRRECRSKSSFRSIRR